MIENIVLVGFSLFYIILVITKTDALKEYYHLLIKLITGRITLADFQLFFYKLFHCGICLSFWLSVCSSYLIGLTYIFCVAGFVSFLWLLAVLILSKTF